MTKSIPPVRGTPRTPQPRLTQRKVTSQPVEGSKFRSRQRVSIQMPLTRDNRWLIGARQRFDHGPAETLLGRPLRCPTPSRRPHAA
jgi:hypothetical protein